MLRLQSPWTRYGLALAATEIASLLYFFAGPNYADADIRYFGFLLAVVVSALLGGLGPGLLATGFAALGSAYLFLPPIFSIQVASEDGIARLALFAGEGILLSFIGGMVRDANTADIAVSMSRRYLLALLFVSTATGLKLLAFAAVERELPFTFFYAAIAASTFSGGLGPGLAATLLSSVSARYFFLDPRYSLDVFTFKDTARVAFFIVEGILLAGLSAKYPKARRIVRDAIAQVRQYTKRMQRSVEDVRALRRISKDVIWELDLATNRMMRGATETESPETPAATMSFSSWLLQIHPEDRPAVNASLKLALQDGSEEWLCEYRRLRMGGTFTHVLDHAYIIKDDARNPVRVVGRTADVSESTRAAGVSSKEREYRTSFEKNPLAILLTDNELRIMTANHAAREVLGYSLSELARMNAAILFEPGRRETVVSMLASLDPQDHPSITIEEECVRADGEIFRGKIAAAVISGAEGRSNGRVIMIEDVSQRS
jgi:PAS domain S-box-containing protein